MLGPAERRPDNANSATLLIKVADMDGLHNVALIIRAVLVRPAKQEKRNVVVLKMLLARATD